MTTEGRNIDIVLCIDGTGSMNDCIDVVKENAERFCSEFVTGMANNNKNVETLRVKLITFRDYADDKEDAMVISRFFELPADNADFKNELDKIQAFGGGDNPENGFEALYYAMMSDFVNGKNDRQVVALFTDADALPLGERKGSPNYPTDMVDENEFYDIWGCVSQGACRLTKAARRMVLFAPLGTAYENLVTKIERCYYQSVNPNNGLEEIDFSLIIDMLVKSASAR